MRLEPLYRATFTTPGAWSAELAGPAGTEGQSFLIAEGRCEGRLPGRLRRANYPRRRTGNALLPDFRGVLQTAGGAAVLFAWRVARQATHQLDVVPRQAQAPAAMPSQGHCLRRGRECVSCSNVGRALRQVRSGDPAVRRLSSKRSGLDPC
jgi:hypothetical protein